MSEDRLRAIFAEGAPDWLEEPALSRLDGGQIVDLLDTQGFFELIGSPYPTGQKAVLNRLVEERLITASGSQFEVRRLGAILLAKRLRDFPDLAQRGARVIVYTGTIKLKTKLDRPGGRGYAVGFMVAGGCPTIEIYANRVETSNPGEPTVPIERFIDGYQSRNERLADVMRRMRICEEKSSGIDRVVQTAEVFQLPAPKFAVGHKRTFAIVYGPKPFDDMDKDDRVRACYQHCALKRVVSDPAAAPAQASSAAFRSVRNSARS